MTANRTTVDRATVEQSRWIVSSRVDVAMVGVPFVLGLVALFVVAATGVREPLWVYLLGFVAFDVAHVWGTAYVTYLDEERFRRRRALYLWPIPASFAAAFALHLSSPVWFWTALAYFAIYHFAKQQYGFIAIYKALAKERSRFDYHLDKATLWVGALGPVLLWHATPAGQFDWFGSGEEFLFRLPMELRPVVAGVMALVGTTWLVRQAHVVARGGRLNRGKTLWMVASWASWYAGVRLSDHLLVSAAFLNFFHGLPFLVLVWRRCNARHERGTTGARLVGWLSARGRAWAFYGFVFAIALVEELLWDGVVWRSYLPSLLDVSPPALSAFALSLWIALLSTPQIVHYFLDGFIWKLNRHNDDLFAVFGLAPPGRGA